jgi:hypothetical protein
VEDDGVFSLCEWLPASAEDGTASWGSSGQNNIKEILIYSMQQSSSSEANWSSAS